MPIHILIDALQSVDCISTGLPMLVNARSAALSGAVLATLLILTGEPTVRADQPDSQGAPETREQVKSIATDAKDVGSETERAPGTRFRDCDACPEVAVLPAGSFLMGSPDSEVGRRDNEGPVRRVTIGYPFAMGVYEVTFAEWDTCVASGGCDGYRPKRRFFGRNWGRPRHPVMRIGWDDVAAYLAWLSQETGERYRLPSEAEWEYAARGGTTTPYHTGDTMTQEEANYGRYFVGRPAPVGSYPPNPFGLYDMLGNLAEWCEDCWNANYVGAPTDGSAWLSGNCEQRVLRGGHWASDAEGVKTGITPRALRAASRGAGAPPTDRLRRLFNLGSRDVVIGFRVVREL